MERLWISFSKDGDGLELSNAACIWLMDLGMISADLNPQFTEANVEAHDFRLEFAKETLQSFKRGRSRSPHRTNGDPSLIRIINEHAVEIVELREKIVEKDRHIANLEGNKMSKMQLALQQKDIEIKFLERSLAIERTCVDKFKELLSHR